MTQSAAFQQKSPSKEQKLQQTETKIKQEVRPIQAFGKKMTNDWVPQLASMLAYSFLTSIIPLLLLLFAVAGFVIGTFSPASRVTLQHSIATALPGGIGNHLVTGALDNLNRSAGLLLIIGIIAAIFSGSRLFVAIENSAGIIFRLKKRPPLRQNIVAISMTLLYVVLVPLIFAVSLIPAQLLKLVGFLPGPGHALVSLILGAVFGWLSASILFGAIYIVLPNTKVRVREIWKGTLIASALLILYELLFPLYLRFFLHPSNYGSIAGFALVVLVFFYYLAFILLLGMEINSWENGQRESAGDLQTMIHAVQVNDSTAGAAGPTAGTPQEDINQSKGESLHKQPKPAEQSAPPSAANRRPASGTNRRPTAPKQRAPVMPRAAQAPAAKHGASRLGSDLQRVALAAVLVVSGRSLQALWSRRGAKSRNSTMQKGTILAGKTPHEMSHANGPAKE